MTRRHTTILCEGARLAVTFDEGAGDAPAALLIVSGGNEVRAGAWGSQAWLAGEIAAAGFPVLRFDRRGVGDSEGVNATYRGAGADIAAAVAFLRDLAPGARLVALGNCDAASALMLNAGCGADALVLSNPWTIEGEDEGASDEAKASAATASLRAHYRARLANPAALLRLLTGKVSLRGLVSSLLALARPKSVVANKLLAGMADGLARFTGPVSILLAERDRIGQAFAALWDGKDGRIRRCADATHSFVEPAARTWLLAHVLEALRAA